MSKAEFDRTMQEKLDRIEHRRDVVGPCTCGQPEYDRCEVCRGPACGNAPVLICCDCVAKVMT